MVKIIGRAFSYNWKYYGAAVAVFVVFWQMFSVFSAVRVADDNLLTAMRQNAAYFEKAFLKGDVFETQRIMWRIKNDNIKRITFHPIEFDGSKWIFKEAIIGNFYDRPRAQLTCNVPFISNGAALGRLEYIIDLVDVNTVVFGENYILFITVVVFFMGLLFLSNVGAIKTIFSIERCVTETNALVDAGKHADIQDSIQRSLQSLPQSLRDTQFAVLISGLAEVLQKASRLESDLAVSKATSDMAAQVAHDIRSPLAALDTALNKTDQLPEKQRIMVRHAVNRIRDIANNLLEKNRQQAKTSSAATSQPTDAREARETRLLSSLIDPVITEKRLQFESKPGINIDFELTPESYGLFARVQPVEFGRMISNLVNNAVEVLGDKGAVKVGLAHDDVNIILTVADNGKGIPPEILAKLGQKGETHGKAGGSGLGLYHARTTVENWNGSLTIASEVGKGTTITIRLPRAEAPNNFVPVLELVPGRPVVVLDDDVTIHQIWDGRFESSRIKEYGIEVIHFSEPDKLRDWVKNNPAKAEKAVYLFDYELIGYKETGLSLAEELGLCGKTILVTSRYEEKRIIDECKRLKIRMLPKGLASLVPIKIGDRVEGIGESENLAVLVDDDKVARMSWELVAQAKGVKLVIFDNPADFLARIEEFPKETPIYLDSELDDEDDGVKGENIAQDLHNKGYANITLETGHMPEDFAHLPWLKVIDKTPPWS